MKKIFRESGFPIFGGKVYVASLKLDCWPPFCNCQTDFQIFCCVLVLLDFLISGVNLNAKFNRKRTFLS